jgi:hypothetical protein
VFFYLSSRHCHYVQLNDYEFSKYCRMITLIRIVFLFLTLLFPKRWISQKYRITQSKFTLSYFILVNDCTYQLTLTLLSQTKHITVVRFVPKVWSLNRWSNKKKGCGVSCAERYTPKPVSK